jgi:hypothetical protein
MIEPAGVVLRGGTRRMIQPWVDGEAASGPGEAEEVSGNAEASLLPDSWRECGEWLADLLVTGARNANVEAWARLAESAAGSGAIHCSDLAARIACELRSRREGLAGDFRFVAAALAAWRMAVDSV